MRHYIEITDQALLQIMLNSIEAYVVIHNGKKRSGIEMHGHMFGNTETTSTTKRHKIEFFSADTSAVMMPGFCIPDEDSRNLKSEIVRSFSNYQLLGDLHTHPYLEHELKNQAALKFMRNIGCEFSGGDRNSFVRKLSESNAEYLIEGVFAINHRPRQSFEGDGKREDNLFEFSVGNLKCFIKIQVFSLNHNGDLIEEPTVLKCQYLEKFKHIELSFDFGRIKIKENKERILEYKPQ